LFSLLFQVKEAAVIAVKSKRWMERPMACVVFNENETMTAEELNEFLAPQMAKVRRYRRGLLLHMQAWTSLFTCANLCSFL
jgi:acyl-CoA synthetase (AMP-forming)/AMP-acid ligase II